MNAALFDPTTCDLLAGVHHNEGAPASLFINGKWVPANNGETRTIINPADNTTVGVVSEASDEDTLSLIHI